MTNNEDRIVAIVYDPNDALLIAQAPAMLDKLAEIRYLLYFAGAQCNHAGEQISFNHIRDIDDILKAVKGE